MTNTDRSVDSSIDNLKRTGHSKALSNIIDNVDVNIAKPRFVSNTRRSDVVQVLENSAGGIYQREFVPFRKQVMDHDRMGEARPAVNARHLRKIFDNSMQRLEHMKNVGSSSLASIQLKPELDRIKNSREHTMSPDRSFLEKNDLNSLGSNIPLEAQLSPLKSNFTPYRVMSKTEAATAAT